MTCKERPILFQDDLVRAILDGRKTETRRLVKPQPPMTSGWSSHDLSVGGRDYRCPYGKPGERLWVREAHWLTNARVWSGLPYTHRQTIEDGHKGPIVLDEYCFFRTGFDRSFFGRWRPSIHMPRWASRITLKVDEVRIERLQAIDQAGARAEGFNDVDSLAVVWDTINGKREGARWSDDPWVWVVRFHRVDS